MFRDVEPRDGDSAVVLATGPGEASRVYRTTDGGQTWEETFRNQEEAAFFNCIDFAPGDRIGSGVSDPVDGKFHIIRTTDGGASWEVLPDAGMPDSTGQFNYSASGDCLTTTVHDAWFGVGGEDAWVYHADDRGMTWTASEPRCPAVGAVGVFALDLANPRKGSRSVGTRRPVCRHELDRQQGSGVGRSRLAYPPRRGRRLAQARPCHWISDEAFHTLDCVPPGERWAAGGDGRVGRR